MPYKVDHLLGKEFALGRQDCYTLVRDFYQDNFGLEMRNYARPNHFWDFGLDLYIDNFRDEGFRPLDAHPKDWRPGDAILMAIKSPIANHAAVIMEDHQILHHLPKCLSRIDSYNRSLYRDTTVAILRHPEVERRQPTSDLPQQNLWDILPDALRRKLSAGLPDGGRP